MRQERLHRLLWAVLLLVITGIVGASAWNRLGTWTNPAHGQKKAPEGLNVFGALPDFSLTERSGNRLSRADLKGKVWVANFIYTSCTDTCPLQSAEMARIQGALPKSTTWRLVSVSVDPE